MRPACLELLRCPSCRHVPLELQAEVWGAQEVREGTLRCAACEETFPIAGGVVEMLREPSEQAQEEIASIDSWLPAVNELTPLNDDWLIGLPNTFHKGAQTDIALNLPRLLELIDPRPGQRVLEVGAGTTWLSNVLAARGCFVVATDITRRLYVGLDSADVLMRHSGTVYDRIQAEMNDIPCVDASFDLIVANAVFHHSENLLETLTEMHRLLRPGGMIYVHVPNYASLTIHLGVSRFAYNEPLGHLNYFTPRTLAAMLRRAGFTRVRLHSDHLEYQDFVHREPFDYGTFEAGLATAGGRQTGGRLWAAARSLLNVPLDLFKCGTYLWGFAQRA